jgi:hypothetical protein
MLETQRSLTRGIFALILGLVMFIPGGIVFLSTAGRSEGYLEAASFLFTIFFPSFVSTYVFTRSPEEAVYPSILIEPVGLILSFYLVAKPNDLSFPFTVTFGIGLMIPGVISGLFGGWLGGRRASKRAKVRKEHSQPDNDTLSK